MIAELHARAASMGEDNATPLDYVEQWVASGKTITALAAEISKASGQDIIREFLSRYIHTTYPQSEERLDAARRKGAHAMAEGAMGIIDDLAAPTRDELAHAKAKVETRWWVAERWNREDLGSKTNVAVTVSGDELLLKALRLREVEQAPTLTALPAADAEYEIVDIDGAPENQGELKL